MAPGASFTKAGENGRGIGSRWYPATLAKRIRAIATIRDRCGFCCEDALTTLHRYRDEADAVFFVDPPYTVAGRRLYRHWDVDHRRLFDTLAQVKGDVLMTYDNSPEVVALAKEFGFATTKMAMKSRQHRGKLELLISRDLNWTDQLTSSPEA